MIGAVHLSVAVHAIAAQQVGSSAQRRHTQPTFCIAWVERRQVTLLAQERRAGLQQDAMVGSMRLVTVAAILAGRRMLPQEGPALLGMALEALFIECGLGQGRRTRASVRAMAVGADHLSGTNGVAGSKQGFGLGALVTGQAQTGFSGMAEYGIVGSMYLVATCATQLGEFVRRTAPLMTCLLFMAGQADSITLCCRKSGVKYNCWQGTHSIEHHQMRSAGAVAGLAAAIAVCKWRARIANDCMGTLQNGSGRYRTVTVVTQQTACRIIGDVATGISSGLCQDRNCLHERCENQNNNTGKQAGFLQQIHVNHSLLDLTQSSVHMGSNPIAQVIVLSLIKGVRVT